MRIERTHTVEELAAALVAGASLEDSFQGNTYRVATTDDFMPDVTHMLRFYRMCEEGDYAEAARQLHHRMRHALISKAREVYNDFRAEDAA